ncbi:tyrosinase precursor [Colletotrichum incanum]|uniref:Tyrosinase n=1 Tax=Colletotrichum incanum TaxID=1573173 RepID=A0A162Q605_COLIC|nr:tyrosinase precursor [Colletotrichum incanum]OHW95548.1 tyrosinase precursor [Colletotrichum incanum]
MASRITLFLSLLLVAMNALAIPYLPTYDYGFDTRKLVKRQAQQPIIVARLPSVNGTVPVRPEIRQMKQNPFKWNLFLLASSMLQYTDQKEELSWYQIAGIHGVPFVPWNGVPGVPGGEDRGYCTHMSVLFPSWHRPYLALYEQVLFRLVQLIASWFSDPTERAFYQAAATDFRIPYWDWATPPPPGEMVYLPEFGEPGIQVYGPRGWQFIANPLHNYKFRPLDPDVFSEGDFPRWTETMRAPFEKSDNQSVAHAIEHARPALQQRLYTLLSNYKDYGPFSNKYWGAATNQSQYDSVESLHDAMHVLVGNRGHLFYIQYSAFDPVFFLHHTMTDRIVAMWQILYPTSWVSPQVAMEHSFTMPPGYVQDMYTELKPFYADVNGTFWNSAMARDTSAFGYSYAETISSPGNDRAENQARLIETINHLYGSSSPSSLAQERRKSATKRNWDALAQVRKGTVSNSRVMDFLHDPDFVAKVVTEDNMYTEWVANVHVQNGALNGSFVVHFFLGEIPELTSSWTVAPGLVGSMPVFAMKNMGSGNHVSGTVPLTSALMHLVSAGAISGLDPEETGPYLEEYLRVRVIGEDGSEKSADIIDSLFVQVASSQVRSARNKWEFPTWGAVVERFVLHHSQGHTYIHS